MSSHQDRPDWDEYFMEIAKVVAARSNCSHREGQTHHLNRLQRHPARH